MKIGNLSIVLWFSRLSFLILSILVIIRGSFFYVYLVPSQFLIEFLFMDTKFRKHKLALPFTIYSLTYLWLTFTDRNRKFVMTPLMESAFNRLEHVLFMGFLYLAMIVLRDIKFPNIRWLQGWKLMLLINLVGIFNEFVQIGMRMMDSMSTVVITSDTYYDIITNLVGTILIYLMFEVKFKK